MDNIEENKENDYNIKGTFCFGEPCPPIPSVMYFLNKEKEKEKDEEHTA